MAWISQPSGFWPFVVFFRVFRVFRGYRSFLVSKSSPRSELVMLRFFAGRTMSISRIAQAIGT
jgi:hypothetical protein